jgi:type II secretory pathway pseudopilin PulG
MEYPHPITPTRTLGFTLVEVVVALGIFVFAVTVLIGAIPMGMKQVQAASNESLSITSMESIRDDLALALASRMATSLRYGLTPPGTGETTPVDFKIMENGELAAANETGVFRVMGSVRRPPAATPGPVQLHLRATWPANAPAGRETGAIELVAAFQP